jgi:hypothetical protein
MAARRRGRRGREDGAMGRSAKRRENEWRYVSAQQSAATF